MSFDFLLGMGLTVLAYTFMPPKWAAALSWWVRDRITDLRAWWKREGRDMVRGWLRMRPNADGEG